MPKYLDTNENYHPPSKEIITFLGKFAKWYFHPTFEGLENVNSKKPGLYISNHTLLGVTDGPLYIPKLYKDFDIYLRVLVDDLHLKLPLWRSVLTDLGAVTASRKHAKELIKQKQNLLIFPGGANEVCKTKTNAYQLDWKERYGFVKMAIENNYPIYPIASLGGDELYDIVADKEDLKESKVGAWLKDKGILDKYFKGGEIVPPIIKGVGPTIIPKPKKIYYKFCKPIQTKSLKKDSSEENLIAIRDKVEKAIYKGLEELKIQRSEAESKEKENPIRKFFNEL